MENLILWVLRIWRTSFGSITVKKDFIEFIIKLNNEQYYSGVLVPIYNKNLLNTFVKNEGLRSISEKDAQYILDYCWCVLKKEKGQIFLPKKGISKEDEFENFFLIKKNEVIDSEKISNESFFALKTFIYQKKNSLKNKLLPETYYYLLIEPL